MSRVRIRINSPCNRMKGTKIMATPNTAPAPSMMPIKGMQNSAAKKAMMKSVRYHANARDHREGPTVAVLAGNSAGNSAGVPSE